LAVADTVFRLIASAEAHEAAAHDQCITQKPRRLVQRYLRHVDEFYGGRIFQVGIFRGGRTAFLTAALEPEKLVAVDLHTHRWDVVFRLGIGQRLGQLDGVLRRDHGPLVEAGDLGSGQGWGLEPSSAKAPGVVERARSLRKQAHRAGQFGRSGAVAVRRPEHWLFGLDHAPPAPLARRGHHDMRVEIEQWQPQQAGPNAPIDDPVPPAHNR
jgi:hypothetical protein